MPAATDARPSARYLFSALILLGSMAICSQSLAQTASERLYQIDLLVFVYESNRSAFVAAPGATAPRMRGAVALKSADPSAATGIPLFTVLDGSSRPALAGARQRLESAGDTRPIAHLAWRQPMFAFQSSRRVSLSQELLIATQAGSAGEEFSLEGTVALQRGRYINLELDLKLSEAGDLWQWELNEDVRDSVYRLKERRQIKLDETHYYDHGAFGAIIRVSSYTPPNQAPLAEPEAEPEASDGSD